MTRLRADALLLLCAIVWGAAFVAQRQAAQVNPLVFVGGRFALSALVIAPLALVERLRVGADGALAGRWLGLAVLIGLCLSAGALMQQWALTWTTATHGGFLTAIYVVFVPLVNWALFRKTPQPVVILACILSLTGAWLLAGANASGSWNRGDLMLLASDGVWATHICLVSHFMGTVQRPYFLCLLQCAIAAVISGLIAVGLHVPPGESLSVVLIPLLYAGVVSGGLGFTLQIVAQRYTPPAEASLIMSLESVFAFLGGAWLLGERLRAVALMGCGSILLAVLIVEVIPTWRRRPD